MAAADTVHYPIALGRTPTARIPLPGGTSTLNLLVERSYTRPMAQVWLARLAALHSHTLQRATMPAPAFDVVPGRDAYFLHPVTAADRSQMWFAYVSLQTRQSLATGTVLGLVVGVDRNSDGLPSADEVLCRATHTTGSVANQGRCHLDLRAFVSKTLWLAARIDSAPDASPVPVEIALRSAAFSLTGSQVFAQTDQSPQLRAELPASIVSDTPFLATLTHRASLTQDSRGLEFGGILLSEANSQSSAFALPLALEFVDVAQPAQPFALAPDAPLSSHVSVTLAPGQAHPRLYLDNSGHDTLNIQVDSLAGIDLYVSRSALPASTRDSTAILAPGGEQVVAVLRGGMGGAQASQVFRLCQGCALDRPVGSGRWFLTPVNQTDRPVTLRLGAALEQRDAMAAPRGLHAQPGNYYNPQRSGEGLFIDQVGQQHVIYFYTFDDDGQPIWYATRGKSERADAWSGSLLRVDRNEQVGRFSVIRDRGSATDLIFSWSIGEVAGSNRLVLAGGAGCALVGGANLAISGHWYAPSQPGWGMNILGTPATTVVGAYFYDAQGAPRWAIGSASLAGNNRRIGMRQLRGACPGCRYVEPTASDIGFIDVAFSDAATADFRAQLLLAAPLPGQFDKTASIVRATDTLACQ